MKVVYDQSGSQVTAMREYDIATNTAVALDQVVKLSSGKVVLAVAGETSPILGIAAEAHSGSADTLNPRANGLRIKVFDAPTQIYECPAPQVTATGGSTTTFVASTIAGFADNDFVGSKMKLIQKGASSTITDPVGTVYPITGSTAASGTMTTTTTITGGCSAGDIFAIFPPVGFQKGNFDSGISKLVLTASAAIPVRVANSDTDRNTIQFEPALHQHGNKNS
ncbi:hypothetical protein [Dehalobacter sp. TeCB1]|uniref:hypothetical protein n=1 Tax=Dehalobacter sp. TeCB1 TaxID=1843715 RepID=UPI00083AA32D|nr:hypothetical protein [Dehalobacter sp. TeCB1]OCZ54315.1 hypothetical protein A7D23_05980 [Dehalobacter sp. TeCB1]